MHFYQCLFGPLFSSQNGMPFKKSTEIIKIQCKVIIFGNILEPYRFFSKTTLSNFFHVPRRSEVTLNLKKLKHNSPQAYALGKER